MEISTILLGGGLVILFGYLAEFIFRKFFIPDGLSLILLGILIGPGVLGIVNPNSFVSIAPTFTTFTLIFLLFVGAIDIDIKHFLKGLGSGSVIAIMYFTFSFVIIAGILLLFQYDIVISFLIGATLGAISPAFVIPVITQLNLNKSNKKLYTVLTLESAFADVLAISCAFTIMHLSILKTFSFQTALSQIVAMFAIAGLVGIIIAIIWVFLESKYFPSDQNYMMTIAILLITYFLTEYLHGSGVIAMLFVGLVLNNSKSLFVLKEKLAETSRKKTDSTEVSNEVIVISKREKLFYEEITFILKTFFFVYVGLLLDLSNMKVVLLGSIIAITMVIARQVILLPVKEFKKEEKRLLKAVYARGIAPAALIQIAIEKNLVTDPNIVQVVYFVITASILLSSIQIFFHKRQLHKQQKQKEV